MTLREPEQSCDVGAIIVTYNSEATLPALLESLERSTVGVRAIIVDNGSRDGTLAAASPWPSTTVIATGANLGYSGGINVGRRSVQDVDAIAVLNPDLVLADSALELMLHALSEPGVGIVAPRLEDAAGARFDSLRREPSIGRALGDSLFGARWRSRPGWLAETLRRDEDYGVRRDVAWAGGAALMISARTNRDVGAWDERTYFLYSEETDYARRARDLGFRVRYEPAAVARHIGSGSGQPAPLVGLLSVNRVRYYERLHGPISTAVFRLAVAAQHVLRIRDERHRYALSYVLHRSRWDRLPSGEPAPKELARTAPERAGSDDGS